MNNYAQTGFQSACSEFAECSLSLNQRYNLLNPSRLIIQLQSDAPLFGLSKGHLLLVDLALRPMNGNLVWISNEIEGGVYRYESIQGRHMLWPGHLKIDENTWDGGVIVLVIKEFISKTFHNRSKTYLANDHFEALRKWKIDNAMK